MLLDIVALFGFFYVSLVSRTAHMHTQLIYYCVFLFHTRVSHPPPPLLSTHQVRYKTYEVLKEETANPRVMWEYLPYSMHMAGPREAIQHMIIRKNFGCTHFIVGRDMAGSKSSITGDDFYGAYEAQDMANASMEKLGVTPVPSLNLVYTEEEGYTTDEYAKEKGLKEMKLSGTKFRQMLRGGDDIPEWFAFKSVVQVLRENI